MAETLKLPQMDVLDGEEEDHGIHSNFHHAQESWEVLPVEGTFQAVPGQVLLATHVEEVRDQDIALANPCIPEAPRSLAEDIFVAVAYDHVQVACHPLCVVCWVHQEAHPSFRAFVRKPCLIGFVLRILLLKLKVGKYIQETVTWCISQSFS